MLKLILSEYARRFLSAANERASVSSYNTMEKPDIKNKKLAGVDYGMKRVGLAVCDEFHVTTSPRKTLLRDSDDFWSELTDALDFESVEGVVVGLPERPDGKNDELIAEIRDFAERLKQLTGLPVYFHDEYLTSKTATRVMIEIGKKKKKRSRKGEKDKVAAALILRNFLDENDS